MCRRHGGMRGGPSPMIRKKNEGVVIDRPHSTGKRPNPTDVYVGSRVRLRRKMLGLSQEKLGDKLGITFQQIQKYEKGTNRVGASRLEAMSAALDVPVSYFFPERESGKSTGLQEEGVT